MALPKLPMSSQHQYFFSPVCLLHRVLPPPINFSERRKRVFVASGFLRTTRTARPPNLNLQPKSEKVGMNLDSEKKLEKYNFTNLPKLGEFADNQVKRNTPLKTFRISVSNLMFPTLPPLLILSVLFSTFSQSRSILRRRTDKQFFFGGFHAASVITPVRLLPIFMGVLLLSSSHILMEIPPYSYLWQQPD